MNLKPFSGIEVVERLASYLNDQQANSALNRFDPDEHKAKRWYAIFHAIDTLTAPFQNTFRHLAGGESPFIEIVRHSSPERSLLNPIPDLPPARCLQDAIEAYELLLHEDFAVNESSDSSPTNRAVARRYGGAYYTPESLAFECVKVACETYIENKLKIKRFLDNESLTTTDKALILDVLSSAKIVDPSCGVARFLVAYINLIGSTARDWFGPEEASHRTCLLRENIWGFDIDPVALGLSRLAITATILSFTTKNVSFAPLLANLALGNLLIKPCDDIADGDAIDDVSKGTIYSLALARPASVRAGEFDIVLGNPPWEKIRLEERDFLLHLHASIKVSTNKGDRSREIQELRVTAPKVFRYLETIRDGIENARESIANDPWFVNSAHGELNTCALFVELGARISNPIAGVTALLVKTSTVTHHANRRLFQYLVKRKLVHKIFEFSNKERLFQIDSRERFSLLILAPQSEAFMLGMNLVQPSDLRCLARQTTLTARDLELLNPDTGMLPVPQSLSILELLKKIYSTNSIFSKVYTTAKFGRLVHLTMHAKDISKEYVDGWLGIQEGKFIERYDGRYSTFEGVPIEKRYTARAAARKIEPSEKTTSCAPVPRYFIHPDRWQIFTKNYTESWSLFWRSTTSSSNSRTCIATILPHLPAIQSLQMAQFPGLLPADMSIILALMNSKVFDFIVRNKLSGIDLTQNVIGQASVPPLSRWNMMVKFNEKEALLGVHVSSRVAALLSDDRRLAPFTQSLINQEHMNKPREQLLDELDYLVVAAYGLSAEDRSAIWDFMKRNPGARLD